MKLALGKKDRDCAKKLHYKHRCIDKVIKLRRNALVIHLCHSTVHTFLTTYTFVSYMGACSSGCVFNSHS